MWNDAVILQHSFGNAGYAELIKYTFPRHIAYANKHGFDYLYGQCTIDSPYAGHFEVYRMIRDALINYKYVVYVDIDSIIVDMDTDLRGACIKPINMCLYKTPEPHYNDGVIYCKNSNGANIYNLVSEVISGAPGTPDWYEQGVVNELLKTTRYKNEVAAIDHIWNRWEVNDPGQPAVVRSYHGWGDARNRLYWMKEMMKNERR